MIEFFVPQEPQGKASPRAVQVAGRARVIKAPKTRAYEAQAALFAAQAMSGRPPLENAVRLDLVAVMGIPASWSGRKRAAALAGSVRPTRRPDLSNCMKACEDAMNGIVFRDDALVVQATLGKVYGVVPGVHVTVKEWVPC
jgi:Holliday junction resolvase RusA-like endonuclease